MIRTESVTAFAPGGVGNVGPGLDILGLAVEGDGDSVRAEWSTTSGISILDPGHPDLPREANRHTAALAGAAVIERAGDRRLGKAGIALSVCKGLPLSGGQGGSAASAVAGAVAVNALLGNPLDRETLVEACLSRLGAGFDRRQVEHAPLGLRHRLLRHHDDVARLQLDGGGDQRAEIVARADLAAAPRRASRRGRSCRERGAGERGPHRRILHQRVGHDHAHPQRLDGGASTRVGPSSTNVPASGAR